MGGSLGVILEIREEQKRGNFGYANLLVGMVEESLKNVLCDLDSRSHSQSHRSTQSGIEHGSSQQLLLGESVHHRCGLDKFKECERQSENQKFSERETVFNGFPGELEGDDCEEEEQSCIEKQREEMLARRDRTVQGKRQGPGRAFQKALFLPPDKERRSPRAEDQVLEGRALPVEDHRTGKERADRHGPRKSREADDDILDRM